MIPRIGKNCVYGGACEKCGWNQIWKSTYECIRCVPAPDEKIRVRRIKSKPGCHKHNEESIERMLRTRAERRKKPAVDDMGDSEGSPMPRPKPDERIIEARVRYENVKKAFM